MTFSTQKSYWRLAHSKSIEIIPLTGPGNALQIRTTKESHEVCLTMPFSDNINLKKKNFKYISRA